MLQEIHEVSNAFSPEQCLADLMTQGCYIFHNEPLARNVDLDYVKWIEQEDSNRFLWCPEDRRLHWAFKGYNDLLRTLYRQFSPVRMWYCNGVEDSSMPWHTDLLEKIDISLLCYLSDTRPEIGGYIAVRNAVSQEGIRLYPKFGDVIILKHGPGWEHRAEPSTEDRFYINCTYRNLEL